MLRPHCSLNFSSPTHSLIHSASVKIFCDSRVQSESNTGSVESSRMRVTLTVEIETIQYDVQACTLRVNGRNVEENDFVRVSGGLSKLSRPVETQW